MSPVRVMKWSQRMMRKINAWRLKRACRVVATFVDREIGVDCKISFAVSGIPPTWNEPPLVAVDALFPDMFKQDCTSERMDVALFKASRVVKKGVIQKRGRACLACRLYGPHPGEHDHEG